MNYALLINPNYAHTYGVVNYTTGEVYTSACDEARYALRSMLHRLDGQVRAAKAHGYDCHIELINLRTETVLMSVDYHAPEPQKRFWEMIEKFYNELEG